MKNLCGHPSTMKRAAQIVGSLVVMTWGVTASANTIPVDIYKDGKNEPSGCTLRDAIANSNLGGQGLPPTANSPCPPGSGDDEIIFKTAGQTIELTLGDSLNVIASTHLKITGSVNIDGYDSARVLHVSSSAWLELTKVWVQNGFTEGGGACLLMDGSSSKLTMTGGGFKDCLAIGNGGALQLSAGTVVLNKVQFIHNSASYGGAMDVGSAAITMTNVGFVTNFGKTGAGAINCTSNAESAQMVLDHSWFEGNFESGLIDPATATLTGGGAIMNKCNLHVTDTSFDKNTAWGLAGAIFNVSGSAGLTVTRGSFSQNSAGGETEGSGGAIYTAGAMTVSQSSFESNNGSWGGGGGIYVGDAGSSPIFVANSTFYNNRASGILGSGHGSGVFSSGKVTNAHFYNNTLSFNFDKSSLYIDPSNSSPSTMIFWSNNIIDSEMAATANCAGNQGGFILGSKNTQWPDDVSCVGMKGVDPKFAPVVFLPDGRVYRVPGATSEVLKGDSLVCSDPVVMSVDEIDAARTSCNVGAIFVP
jgi:predicted outer membrane repeat protein